MTESEPARRRHVTSQLVDHDITARLGFPIPADNLANELARVRGSAVGRRLGGARFTRTDRD